MDFSAAGERSELDLTMGECGIDEAVDTVCKEILEDPSCRRPGNADGVGSREETSDMG